jgi:hypothetical protein
MFGISLACKKAGKAAPEAPNFARKRNFSAIFVKGPCFVVFTRVDPGLKFPSA